MKVAARHNLEAPRVFIKVMILQISVSNMAQIRLSAKLKRLI